MATVNTIDGDLYVRGSIVCTTLGIPAGTVDNSDVNASAAIAASKLEHHHTVTSAIESTTSNSTQRWPVHIVHGTSGKLISFEAGQVTVKNLAAGTSQAKQTEGREEWLKAEGFQETIPRGQLLEYIRKLLQNS